MKQLQEFSVNVEGLSEELQQRQEELLNLRQEKAGLIENISMLEKEKADAISNWNSQLALKEEELAKTKHDKTSLEESLLKSQDQVKTQEADVEHLTSELTCRQKEICDLNSKCSQLEKTLEESNSSNAELSANLAASSNELNESHLKNDNLIVENTRLTEAIGSLEKDMGNMKEELSRQLEAKEAEIYDLVKVNEELALQVQEQERNDEEKKSLIETLNQQIASMEREVSDLNARSCELTENLSVSEKENAKQLARVNSLEAELNEKVSELDIAGNTNKELSDSLSSLQEQLDNEKESLKKFKKDAKKAFKEKVTEFKEKEESYSEQIKKLTARGEEQDCSITSLKEMVAEREAEISRLNGCLDEKEGDIISLKGEMEAMRVEGEKVESALSDELADVNKRLKESESHCSELNKENEQKAQDIERQCHEIQSLQNMNEGQCLEITTLNMNCDEKDKQIKVLEVSLHERSQLIETKSCELESSNNEFQIFKEESQILQNDMKDEIAKLQSDLSNREGEISVLSAHKSDLEQELAGKMKQLQEFSVNVECLSAELRQKHQEFAKLKDNLEIVIVNAGIVSLEAEKIRHDDMISKDVGDYVRSENSKYYDLAEGNEGKISIIENIEKLLEEKNGFIKNLKNNVIELEDNLVSLSDSCDMKLVEMQEGMDELCKKLIVKDNDLVFLTKELDSVKKSNFCEIEDLQEKLEKAMNRLKQAEGEMDQVELKHEVSVSDKNLQDVSSSSHNDRDREEFEKKLLDEKKKTEHFCKLMEQLEIDKSNNESELLLRKSVIAQIESQCQDFKNQIAEFESVKSNLERQLMESNNLIEVLQQQIKFHQSKALERDIEYGKKLSDLHEEYEKSKARVSELEQVIKEKREMEQQVEYLEKERLLAKNESRIVQQTLNEKIENLNETIVTFGKELVEKERVLEKITNQKKEGREGKAEGGNLSIIDEKEKKIEQLEGNIAVLTNKLNNYVKVNDSKETELTQLKRSILALGEFKSNAISDLHDKEKVITALHEELEKSSQRNIGLIEKIDKLYSNLEEEQARKENMDEELDSRKKLVAALEEERLQLKKELLSFGNENSGISEQLNEASMRNEVLLEQVKTQKMEFIDKEKELLVTVTQLEKNLELRLEEIEIFKANIAQNDDIEKANMILTERLRIKEADLLDLAENHANEKETLETKFQDLFKELDEKNKTLEKSSFEIETLKEGLASSASLLEASISAQRQEKDILEKERNELRDNLDKKNDMLEDYKVERSRLQTENQSLTKTLENKVETNEMLHRTIEDLNFEKKKLAGENKELLEELFRLKDVLGDRQMNFEKYENDIGTRKKIIFEMESENKLLREKLEQYNVEKTQHEAVLREEYGQEVHSLRQQVESLNLELIRNESRLAEVNIQSEVRQESLKMRDSNNRVKELRDQLYEQRELLDSCKLENRVLQNQILQQQELIDYLRNEVASFKDSCGTPTETPTVKVIEKPNVQVEVQNRPSIAEDIVISESVDLVDASGHYEVELYANANDRCGSSQMENSLNRKDWDMLQQKTATLQTAIRDLEEQKFGLEEQLAVSEGKIKEYERLVVKFAEETEEANIALKIALYHRDSLQDEMYRLQGTLAWREREFANQLSLSQNEVIQLKDNLFSKDEELEKNQISYDAKCKHYQMLENLLKEREVSLQQAEEKIDRLTSENDIYEGERVTLQKRIEQLQGDMQQQRQMYNKNINALQQYCDDVSKNSEYVQEQLVEQQQKFQGKCVDFFIISSCLKSMCRDPI